MEGMLRSAGSILFGFARKRVDLRERLPVRLATNPNSKLRRPKWLDTVEIPTQGDEMPVCVH